MEFFRSVEIEISEAELCSRLALKELNSFNSSLLLIDEPNDHHVRTGGIWGEFTLTRDPIAGGVRFALKECPNALSWTVTTGFPPEPEKVVIHLTINRKEKDPAFIEELEEFLEDFAEGITTFLTTKNPVLTQD
ncbi:hypothetical protein [Salinimicrobium sp. HB62]|uniref:hypothetical protein n=1 Tax=Salinimicrobium sp. HB62 TaxID=3077781 RepID=UPI002D79270E|nr:hypothetical protein [Salinimicrobium sp. HB62]